MARVLKVLAQLETPCVRCGAACTAFGMAEVLPDGRIGEGVAESSNDPTCKTCRSEKAAEINKQRRADRQRRAWMAGKGKLKGGK